MIREHMQHEPDVLVNVTNDAWYGDSYEPLIHLALAGFRAVENRRYLVRSTQTGISAFVDPLGRFVEPTATYERASIMSEVVPLSGRTLYSRLGDWPGMLCAMVAVYWIRRRLRDFGRWLVRRRS
jgi:apolipoprotein N-acyltransferase